MKAAQTNPVIEEAWDEIKVLSGDERARALAEAREKARMDLDSWLDDARTEGWNEGWNEGRNEWLLEVARKLLRKKMSFDDIADATDLPLEEVKQLASGLTD